MKKIKFVGLGAVAVSLCLSVTSCNGGGSIPKASLKTESDSIAYAYGTSIAEGGLLTFAEQQGVVESTNEIEYEYSLLISNETDSVKIKSLEKELESKVKDIEKANAAKIEKLVKGILQGIEMTEKDKETAIGIGIGNQIASQILPNINKALYGEDSSNKLSDKQVVAAIANVLKGEETAISGFEANAMIEKAMTKAQEIAQAKEEEEAKIIHAEAIALASEFLKANKEKEGVITLESGLQYEIIKEGKGAIPTTDERVNVHYHGTLIDGTVFDSSVDRGEPITFGVTQVIKGWTEALQLMPVGSKWKLYIPAELAYGAQERGAIKPYSTLIFDVELLGIEK